MYVDTLEATQEGRRERCRKGTTQMHKYKSPAQSMHAAPLTPSQHRPRCPSCLATNACRCNSRIHLLQYGELGVGGDARGTQRTSQEQRQRSCMPRAKLEQLRWRSPCVVLRAPLASQPTQIRSCVCAPSLQISSADASRWCAVNPGAILCMVASSASTDHTPAAGHLLNASCSDCLPFPTAASPFILSLRGYWYPVDNLVGRVLGPGRSAFSTDQSACMNYFDGGGGSM
jgi:hypothetical protein